MVFNVPYLAGRDFIVGPQPFNPGEPNSSFPMRDNSRDPWPVVVGVLNLLIGNPGEARGYPVQQSVAGTIAPKPSDTLYIRGFVGKSLG